MNTQFRQGHCQREANPADFGDAGPRMISLRSEALAARVGRASASVLGSNPDLSSLLLRTSGAYEPVFWIEVPDFTFRVRWIRGCRRKSQTLHGRTLSGTSDS